MNSLTGKVPANRNQANSPTPRTLLLSVRPNSFAAIDEGLAALDRPPAERSTDCAETIALLRRGGFDMLVVDLVRDGTAHLTAIEARVRRRLLSGIVCVAISADPESTPTQKAIEIGIDDLLREPLDRTVARLCFSACLERRKLRDDSLQYWMTTAKRRDRRPCARPAGRAAGRGGRAAPGRRHRHGQRGRRAHVRPQRRGADRHALLRPGVARGGRRPWRHLVDPGAGELARPGARDPAPARRLQPAGRNPRPIPISASAAT